MWCKKWCFSIYVCVIVFLTEVLFALWTKKTHFFRPKWVISFSWPFPFSGFGVIGALTCFTLDRTCWILSCCLWLYVLTFWANSCKILGHQFRNEMSDLLKHWSWTWITWDNVYGIEIGWNRRSQDDCLRPYGTAREFSWAPALLDYCEGICLVHKLQPRSMAPVVFDRSQYPGASERTGV